ncbi:MAG: hypothetical protein NTY20_03585 [Candidatus Aenigmarchaeota archaeon]|nr:hypothetical protein [Candidatus Aenigmarchaeota archaeon]
MLFFMVPSLVQGQQKTHTEGIKLFSAEAETIEQATIQVEDQITDWLRNKNIRIVDKKMDTTGVVQRPPIRYKYTVTVLIHYLKLD